MGTSQRLKLSPEAEKVLTDQWQGLGKPGNWWLGAERLEIARQVREARACPLCRRRKQALSPYAVAAAHASTTLLSASVVDAIHRLVTDPGRLSRRWFDELLESGLRPEAVVETIGVVAIVCFADTLSRGLGRPVRRLPAARPGDPTGEIPDGLEEGYAWVPTVKPERAKGYVADLYAFYSGAAQQGSMMAQIPNIMRALTAVPATLQQYYSMSLIGFPLEGSTDLSQAQVELVSASTSAINSCFY